MSGLRQYAIVTGAYWSFTLTDGALRLIVLLHFHELGYTPLQLASLFLLYEFCGILTNLFGGWIGSLAIGFFATTQVNSLAERESLFYGGGVGQLVVQVVIALFAMLWSGVLTLVVALALKYTMGWRIADEDEVEGIDFVEHGETAYDFASRSGAPRGPASPLATSVKTEGANA